MYVSMHVVLLFFYQQQSETAGIMPYTEMNKKKPTTSMFCHKCKYVAVVIVGVQLLRLHSNKKEFY